MSQLTLGAVRAATFIAETQRLDFLGRQRFAPSQKTTGKVHCDPPNRPCGARCIPPTWRCRITGGGTDSHSRAMETDLVGGANTFIRGVKSTWSGVQKKDPELVTRGIKGIQRGVIKVTPGKDKDEKADFARRVRLIGGIVSIGIFGGWVTGATHRAVKKLNPAYAQGLGKAIDDAARNSVSRVADTWDSIVERVGFAGLSTGRARIARAGTATARQVGRGGLFRNNFEYNITEQPIDQRFIGSRALYRTRSTGLLELKALDRQAISENWNFERWQSEKVKALYSLKTDKKISVFAAPAAHDWLAGQWGFKMPHNSLRQQSINSEILDVRRKLVETIDQAHTDLVADLKRRGLSQDQAGYQAYAEQILKENPNIIPKNINTETRQHLEREFNYNITALLSNTTAAGRRTYAYDAYKKAVTFFDEYFTDAAARINVNESGSKFVKLDPDSPFYDATVGLTRFHAADSRSKLPAVLRGRPFRLTREQLGTNNRDVASMREASLFLNRWYFHTAVRKETTRFPVTRAQASRMASVLSGRRITSLTEAEAWFRDNGFNVHIPGERPIGRRRDATPEDDLPPRVRAYLEVRQDLRRPDGGDGKRCGRGYIPQNHKCREGESQVAAPQTAAIPSTNPTIRNALITGGSVAAAALLGSIGVKQQRITAYKKGVAKSAIEAEKMAQDFMQQMRQSAATRLGKPVQDVTDFEASVYNFKDSGYDRGFGSNDKSPAYFGQTKDSRGAVVMLSYADDNKFTKRGQGSYLMAKENVFSQIWGEHDILPFANNISQPKARGADDLTVSARERLIKRAGRLGPKVKEAIFLKEALGRFDYLRDNINNRGFNPDAIRAAAFVTAQRRLTGKPVHLMSYSNGGNVASETLAILSEMGYRDVRAVNIAGPTFGLFKHSPDNMRTWVSPGDEFWKTGTSAVFQGSNVTMLDNPNIPHGLTAKIDRNNREHGANWRENYKAKNSYTLDEQLQREAYRFLTVDKGRSRELADEFVWRVAENKPMEGDLDVVLGAKAADIRTQYTARRAKNKDQADTWLRDQIEQGMIDVWYGGYDPKRTKNAQKSIKEQLASLIGGSD